jgi:hypothetical protein
VVHVFLDVSVVLLFILASATTAVVVGLGMVRIMCRHVLAADTIVALQLMIVLAYGKSE